jgi:hypothetical protein
MLNRTVAVAIALCIGLAGSVARGDAKSEKAAVKAAVAWLKLVDAGKYDKSWDEASKLIQKAVKKPDWAKKMKMAHGMFGKLVSRKLATKKFHTSLPGAPDGKYVVITYKSSFKKKKKAVETITPKLEGGKWKVSGYFIK